MFRAGNHEHEYCSGAELAGMVLPSPVALVDKLTMMMVMVTTTIRRTRQMSKQDFLLTMFLILWNCVGPNL